jgi:hypothetical protein
MEAEAEAAAEKNHTTTAAVVAAAAHDAKQNRALMKARRVLIDEGETRKQTEQKQAERDRNFFEALKRQKALNQVRSRGLAGRGHNAPGIGLWTSRAR